jgi:hypothetical protein
MLAREKGMVIYAGNLKRSDNHAAVNWPFLFRISGDEVL